jgi:hypothetical protein
MKNGTIASCALAAALCASSFAAAASQDGLTFEQIQAAASGAPMNGGALALTLNKTPTGIPYLMGVIPNTTIPISMGGMGCKSTAATDPCQGFMIVAIGTANLQAQTMNDFAASAPYMKVYREQQYTAVTTEQLLVGGSAETVRHGFLIYAAGFARFIQLMSQQTTTVSFDKGVANFGMAEETPQAVLAGAESGAAAEAEQQALVERFIDRMAAESFHK